MAQFFCAWENAKTVFLYALGALIGLTAYSLISSTFINVPAWYDSTWPVVRFGYVDKRTGKVEEAIQHIERTPERMCWSIYMEKLQPADNPRYEFRVRGGDTSASIPTSAYLVDDRDGPLPPTPNGRNLIPHVLGEQWHRRYCFDNAVRVPDFHEAEITGHAEHDRWPYRWTTITPTPTFTIGRVSQ